MKRVSILLAFAAIAAGCDGGTTAIDSGTDSGPLGGVVRGIVSYSGASSDPLLIGVWRWNDASPSMPMGPPFEYEMIPAPTYPVTYELTRLDTGSYFAGAVIDVGRDSPTLPGDEDLEAYTGRIEVVEGETLTLNLEITDD